MTKSRNPLRRRRRVTPVVDRFWSCVRKGEGCWEWIGRRNEHGYGRLHVGDSAPYAHRLSYELHIGSVPDGMHVLHRCDNPSCVRPDHLFLGTQADNNADRHAKGRSRSGCAHRGKTHCVHGHEFTPENTYVNKAGWRYCRACHREQELARQRRLRHAAA